MTRMKNDFSITKVLPVLFGFFIMGFVDVVGISTNYVKLDFALSDTVANLLPMMLFVWFAVLSVPTGLMMNRLGRKNTVIVSMGITLLAMLMPVIAGVAAGSFGNWKLIFPVFAALTIIAGLWLLLTPIHEEPVNKSLSSFAGCFGLLKDKTILMLFLGIVFVVGVDVGLNTTIPKFLIDRFNIPLEKAGLGISLYFMARTIGAFAGAIILAKLPGRKFFIASMSVAIPALIAMLFIGKLWAGLLMVFLVGLAVANVFSIIFAAALKKKPERANEISGLLVMGIAGGAVMPLIMGMVSDSFGQTAGMAVLLVALTYLLFSAIKMEKV